MRITASIALLSGVLGALVGCAPIDLSDGGLLGDLSLANDPLGLAGLVSPSLASSRRPTLEGDTLVSGALDVGDYAVYSLGPAQAGQLWSISRRDLNLSTFVVVLFNQDYELLYRSITQYDDAFEHVMREDTGDLLVGIAPAVSSSGGSFELHTGTVGEADVPAPRRQLVYLDYRAADNLAINNRTGISFDAFDSAYLGDSYVGQTAEFKALILEEMQRDYAAFDVDFVSSDDGPPPAEAHSVVHFGGNGNGLLGLADNVDNYNADESQRAIVFVNTFSIYWTMQLTTAEMAQMIANTASHELGHLLGLYHVADPDELMDTTAGAWEMVEDQAFGGPAALEQRVFPVGTENSIALLEQIVGQRPGGPLPLAKDDGLRKPVSRAKIRMLAKQELSLRCGNCANPDR